MNGNNFFRQIVPSTYVVAANIAADTNWRKYASMHTNTISYMALPMLECVWCAGECV